VTLDINTMKHIALVVVTTLKAGFKRDDFKLPDAWVSERANNAAMAIADLFDDENPDGVVGTLRRFLAAETEANRLHGERNHKLHQALGMEFGENEYIHERVERLVSALRIALGVVEHPNQFTVDHRIRISREINKLLPQKAG
jgi:hypothetical protein